MPVAALPSLPQVVARLSHRPAIPFSLNALYVLLTPFLPSPASPVPPASTWDSVYAYYGPGTQAVWFEAAGEPDTWAVILTRQLEPGLVKVHSALSDPSPTSSSRQALFTDVMAHLKATHAGSTVSFGGVPDGLQPTFDGFVVGDKGVPSRSYKVQKTLDDALAEHPGGKVLDETKFARGSLTWEEVPEVRRLGRLVCRLNAVARPRTLSHRKADCAARALPWPPPRPFRLQALATFKSSYAPAAFEKLLHFTSCIRDLSTPAQKPISWCLVYEDRASCRALRNRPAAPST